MLHESWVRCIHPGWDLLVGWDLVKQSWQQIFSGTRWIRVIPTSVDVQVLGDVAVVGCAENITAQDGGDVGVAVAQATNLFLHTGSINLIRPSVGSWVLYGLGSENQNLPGFVTLCPSMGNGGPRNWNNAFLPATHQGTAIGRAGMPATDARIRNLTNTRISGGDQLAPIRTVVVSTQTGDESEVSPEEIREGVREHVIFPALPDDLYDPAALCIHINPTGRFVVGGPQGDAGVTGRKIIVDTYGGFGRHGGGAFSGKDPTKVDRSGAYAARWIAKNLVASGLAARCEVQLAYAIGVAEPVSVMVDTFGTGKMPDELLAQRVREAWDLRPRGIIRALELQRPIYRPTAAYGHFGRQPGDGLFTWESVDKAEELRDWLE